MHRTGTQARAAKEAGVSVERFRRFLRSNALAERHGRRWIITDKRKREMTAFTRGGPIVLDLPDFDQASLNGRHRAAVKAVLSSNDVELLRPFEGLSVIDAKGKAHPFETNPNTLYRLAFAGGEAFHEIYRLVL